MATFKVTFKNRLSPDGEPVDLPADALVSNGARIESYGFAGREIKKGETFSRDIWEYEIRDSDADRFVDGLKRTPTVIDFEKQ
jgi:hypothetical protein